MVAEKILTGPETLRKDWLVHGTTGYDFANQVAISVLVDSSAERGDHKNIPSISSAIPCTFGHLALCEKAARDEIIARQRCQCSGQHGRSALRARTDGIAISRSKPWPVAVRETIACFPVYRTYLAPGRPVSDEDRQRDRARRRCGETPESRAIEESIFNFLRDILVFRFPENL